MGGKGNEQKQDPAAAPEAYEFKLRDGLTISDDMKTRLTEVAKGAKLDQKTMDALLEMHGEVMYDVIHQAEKQKNDWAEECSKQGLLDEVKLGYAKEAVKVFGGSAAMDVLVATGAANHPAVQKMLQNIGELLAEDNPPAGNTHMDNPVKGADLLFPNSKY